MAREEFFLSNRQAAQTLTCRVEVSEWEKGRGEKTILQDTTAVVLLFWHAPAQHPTPIWSCVLPPSSPCLPRSQVSLAALPPDVSLPTAEAVLFIGKAVRVLKQPMSSAASHQALRAHAEILGFARALHALRAAEAPSAVQFDHCVETMRAKVGSGAVCAAPEGGQRPGMCCMGAEVGRNTYDRHAASVSHSCHRCSRPAVVQAGAAHTGHPVYPSLPCPSLLPTTTPLCRCLRCCGTWCSTGATWWASLKLCAPTSCWRVVTSTSSSLMRWVAGIGKEQNSKC